jgi:hypothetical protein
MFCCLSAAAHDKLWKAYVTVDYNRKLNGKFRGFNAFVKDQTNANHVSYFGVTGIQLYFDNKARYSWFVLKWG